VDESDSRKCETRGRNLGSIGINDNPSIAAYAEKKKRGRYKDELRNKHSQDLVLKVEDLV